MSIITTRQQARGKVAEVLGAQVGTITSGTTTTVTIDELRNNFSSDAALVSRAIVLPNSASADQRRLVEGWDDSAGEITLNDSISAPSAGDPYEIYQLGDPPKQVIDSAMARAMTRARRIVEIEIPMAQGRSDYYLHHYAPWVSSRDDIVSVGIRDTPQLLPNEDFTVWGDGVTPNLLGWALTGDSALLTRIAPDDAYGRFGARLSRSGTDAALTAVVGLLDRQLVGKTLQYAIGGVAAAASRLQVTIDDGDTQTTGTHSGDGEHEWLEGSHVVSADASGLTVALECVNGDANVDFTRAILHEGANLNTRLRDYGSQQRHVEPVRARTLNVSTGAMVSLPGGGSRGMQLVVGVRQPFAAFTSETSVTDMPVDHIVAATIVELARRFQKSEDRTRWEALAAEYRPYAQHYESQRRAPGQRLGTSTVITGA